MKQKKVFGTTPLIPRATLRNPCKRCRLRPAEAAGRHQEATDIGSINNGKAGRYGKGTGKRPPEGAVLEAMPARPVRLNTKEEPVVGRNIFPKTFCFEYPSPSIFVPDTEKCPSPWLVHLICITKNPF